MLESFTPSTSFLTLCSVRADGLPPSYGFTETAALAMQPLLAPSAVVPPTPSGFPRLPLAAFHASAFHASAISGLPVSLVSVVRATLWLRRPAFGLASRHVPVPFSTSTEIGVHFVPGGLARELSEYVMTIRLVQLSPFLDFNRDWCALGAWRAGTRAVRVFVDSLHCVSETA